MSERECKVRYGSVSVAGGKRWSGGGGEGKGGGSLGGGCRWDVLACLNTVGEKSFGGVQSEVLPSQHLECWADGNKWNIKKQAN